MLNTLVHLWAICECKGHCHPILHFFLAQRQISSNIFDLYHKWLTIYRCSFSQISKPPSFFWETDSKMLLCCRVAHLLSVHLKRHHPAKTINPHPNTEPLGLKLAPCMTSCCLSGYCKVLWLPEHPLISISSTLLRKGCSLPSLHELQLQDQKTGSQGCSWPLSPWSWPVLAFPLCSHHRSQLLYFLSTNLC